MKKILAYSKISKNSEFHQNSLFGFDDINFPEITWKKSPPPGKKENSLGKGLLGLFHQRHPAKEFQEIF